MSEERTLIHATAVAVDGRAALIIGPSGAGKSDLALRTMTMPVRVSGRMLVATLLADDQVALDRHGDRLVARPPDTIAGRIEVRGIGILTFPHVAEADVGLVAAIGSHAAPERFPDPPPRHHILGLDIPLIVLNSREATAHIKLLLALDRMMRGAA